MKTAADSGDLVLVHIDERGDAGHVAHVTINNPAKRNALGMAGKRAIATAFSRLSQDEKLRVVVLTGEGDRSFIAGADLTEMKDLSVEEAEEEHTLTHYACDSIRRCPVPVIARVNGYCLGAGMELAASCDMRASADHAKFGMPEVRVGLPSGMEAALLPSLLGWGRAAELVLTGDIFDARDMYQFGFLQKLVPAAELDAAVDKWIQSILISGARAVRLQKSLLRDWERMSLTDSIRRGIEMCVEARRTDEPAKLMAEFLARKKSQSKIKGDQS